MVERIYLDADSCDERLAAALGRDGISVVWGTREVATGADDETQLRRAVEFGAVIVTGNFVDFARLHAVWSGKGWKHFGIITIRRMPPRSAEAIAAALGAVLANHSPETLANSFHRI